MSDQLKVILLASAAIATFFFSLFVVVAIGVGAFLFTRESADETAPGDNPEINVPLPGSDSNWIAPILGKDPDAYRLPFRRNDQCDGPNCPY